jgi:hypothetical protein
MNENNRKEEKKTITLKQVTNDVLTDQGIELKAKMVGIEDEYKSNKEKALSLIKEINSKKEELMNIEAKMNYNKGKFDQLSELLIKEIKKEEVAK